MDTDMSATPEPDELALLLRNADLTTHKEVPTVKEPLPSIPSIRFIASYPMSQSLANFINSIANAAPTSPPDPKVVFFSVADMSDEWEISIAWDIDILPIPGEQCATAYPETDGRAIPIIHCANLAAVFGHARRIWGGPAAAAARQSGEVPDRVVLVHLGGGRLASAIFDSSLWMSDDERNTPRLGSVIWRTEELKGAFDEGMLAMMREKDRWKV